MDRNRRIIKKEYLPQSKAYKVYYEGGGIGYGSDSENNEHLGSYVDEQKSLMKSQGQVLGQSEGGMSVDDIKAMRDEFDGSINAEDMGERDDLVPKPTDSPEERERKRKEVLEILEEM